MRHAFAAKPREPLRTAVTRDNAELHFRLAELRAAAGQSNGACLRQFSAASECESIDGRDRGLAQCFEIMEHALSEERGLASAHRRLLRQFVDVRAGHKRFFARPGEDERAHAGIRAGFAQDHIQLLHGAPVQRIQKLRAIERDAPNLVVILVQQILVPHVHALKDNATRY